MPLKTIKKIFEFEFCISKHLLKAISFERTFLKKYWKRVVMNAPTTTPKRLMPLLITMLVPTIFS